MLRWLVALVLVARVAGAEPAQIVLLGEVHDNPEAHVRQAAELRALQPKAVIFEMLSPEAAARADANRDAVEEVTQWEASGWPPFALYAPVFEALGEAKILGMAAPRQDVRAAFNQGAAAVFGPESARFGLVEPLSEAEQNAREDGQFTAHCEAMPREMMGGMVEAQRYRDAVFAQAALEALEAFGAPVVLILGGGHARTDWGVPALIRYAAPETVVRAVAFIEAPEGTFDEVYIVPPAERPDPCAAFSGN